PILEKRAQNVRLRLVPGFERRGQIRSHSLTDDRPDQEHDPYPYKGQYHSDGLKAFRHDTLLDYVMHNKPPGVLLRLRRIECDPIKECFCAHIFLWHVKAHVLGYLTVDVGPVHAIGEPGIVHALLHHAPASELREPPDSV